MHVADAALAEIRSAGRGGYRGCVVGGDVSTLAQERGWLTGARCPPRMRRVLVLGVGRPKALTRSSELDLQLLYYFLYFTASYWRTKMTLQ
jgi:hypothetical protein